MSRKKDANKYWIYGEDAALAAQFTAYLATVLKNRRLMWEAIKPYLHKLSPKECEVMICLYIDRLSIADTATKLKIKPDTVSTHKHNAINKIRKAMGEH